MNVKFVPEFVKEIIDVLIQMVKKNIICYGYSHTL